MSSVLVTHSTSKNVFGSVARYWLEDNKCYSTWFITWSRGYNIFSRVRSVHEKPLTMNLHQLFHSQIAPHFQHWACSVLSDRISWRLIVDMFWYIFRFIHPLQSVVNDNNSLFSPVFFHFDTLDSCLSPGLCCWETSIPSHLLRALQGADSAVCVGPEFSAYRSANP